MNEPPWRYGVLVPPADNFVTVVSNKSGIETDDPGAQRRYERTRQHIICKICNEKEAQSSCC